ncbi:monovalent cation/H(+) antiporter subunit G [Povalibacter sp.]|uniref:monovalent cation/H(+) antiporter subunit G n=1 Tax=Povalibacter sp. TaxID=1962978 RepID=UPI002D1FB22A|nr:monovalent cation/H(+) antiporter subunit G [Povalibacter sp.]
MMTELPVWAALIASLLLVCGGLLCLLGAIGLLKMPTFYMRMHSPSMGNTLGTGCILIASIVISSAMAGRPILHELMITLFMVMTAPVSAMMIMRAAIYRTGVHEARRARQSPED